MQECSTLWVLSLIFVTSAKQQLKTTMIFCFSQINKMTYLLLTFILSFVLPIWPLCFVWSFFLPRWPFTQTSQDKDAHSKSGIKTISNRNSKTNKQTFLKNINYWIQFMANMYNYCCRRDPFNTSDLWSGTLFLSLSCICLHFLLLS